MSQPLRIENPNDVNFITTRTEASRLHFVNNKSLEDEILGALAKYQETRNVTLYAFALQGNHYHDLAQFLDGNRASFMRDFNSRTTWICKRHLPHLEQGKFWERRYSQQEVPHNEDIEERFFYCALQAVHDGLVRDPKNYAGYNSFYDAVAGIERECKVVNWTKYNNAKRSNPSVPIESYTTTHYLKYSRLPGYDHLSQEEYKALMYKKFEEKRVALVEERIREGKGFADEEALRATVPGAKPLSTKKSTRYTKRPQVLTSCNKTRHERLETRREVIRRYTHASHRYLKGDITVEFPLGTYRPPIITPIRLQT